MGSDHDDPRAGGIREAKIEKGHNAEESFWEVLTYRQESLQICDVLVTTFKFQRIEIQNKMAEVHGNRTHLTRF